MALPLLGLASMGASTGLPIIGGILQSGLTKMQSEMSARATLMQGEAFTYRMNAESNLSEVRNVHQMTQDQIFAYDLSMKSQLDDMTYEYAKAGIPMSGSALQNMKSNITQAALQRKLIADAGSKDELNLQLAAINSNFMANMSEINAKYTAKAQRQTGKAQASMMMTQAFLQAVSGGISSASRFFGSSGTTTGQGNPNLTEENAYSNAAFSGRR